MDAAVKAFDVSADNLVATMKQMELKLRETLSLYKGRQAEAFDGVLGALQKQMTKAAGDLQTMSSLVSTADHHYVDEDLQIQRHLNALNDMVAETNSNVLDRLAGQQPPS